MNQQNTAADTLAEIRKIAISTELSGWDEGNAFRLIQSALKGTNEGSGTLGDIRKIVVGTDLMGWDEANAFRQIHSALKAVDTVIKAAA